MKPKFFLFLLLSLYIVNCTFYIEAQATIRYVSKTGSSIPPYTSWQTAADSIQKCINICSFGDTVYVANGVYQEQIIMIPGLSLIGAGMDSCVIDTREIVEPNNFWSVTLANNSDFTGFNIKVSNDTENGGGIRSVNNSEDSLFYSNVSLNKIETAFFGILIDNFASVSFENKTYFHHNILSNMGEGVITGNASSHISENYLTNILSRGIDIESIVYSYKPIIEKNVIYTSGTGINESIGTKPTIRNNIIILSDDNYATGIWCGLPDSLWILNNLIISDGSDHISGFINSQLPIFQLNNILIGNFANSAISAGDYNYIYNNSVNNSSLGIYQRVGTSTIKYNNSYHNTINYSGFTPDSTNLSVNPMIVNDDTTRGELDFHLQMFSPLIDSGDPNILDKDGSRSDIGLYGGPFGESYKYLDLAPSPPLNLTAVLDSNEIFLSWNKNSEADTSFYKVYRDTVINFQVDSTKLISSSADTFFVQINPHNVTKYVYKVTCVDKQNNESEPSEEKVVNITGIEHYPQIITDYQLYQNYPNPFNPVTKISYRLKERGYVKLYVYDIKGELVSVLVNQEQNAGFYQVEFNSSDNQQPTTNNLASGIYIYQILVTGENNTPVFSDIKKMIMLK